uniref:Putative nuclease HARBI1 n=1 Tax=Crassostrea virginica TaxID=6565 RepID=A0A8B8BXI7_CRAVI|nr:putative nuclease HARBI1 [Crassostrea virginica]
MVKIIAPKENENDYMCRKGYYALNIQMMCDSRFKIRDIVAKWPGSVHDSWIFRESYLSRELERGQLNGVLLGDSGYPLKPYLMTPYTFADTLAAQNYNSAHCKTRVTIEQTYGIIKKRFNSLHSGLRTCPLTACRIIVACVVLHNIGLERGDILREVPQIDMVVQAGINQIIIPDDAVGQTVRNHLRDTYF